MKTTGRYEIREVLGEGGMGVVYRAFDPVMGREVTLKTLKNPQDKTALDLFKRECAVLASLAHPNIVEIHDIGESEDGAGKHPYFVMPLLRGATLENLIKSSSTRLTAERSIQIVSQVCRGLQAAHDQGLVHRDLKPSNIFILEDDSVKIIDFGVAHLMDQRTMTGLKGTLAYMSPEQTLLKPPTPLSDQFSVAVVCYEMLAHRHPFKVPGYADLAEAIQKHVPAPISDVNHAITPVISQVVHKALAKEAVHRFADVRELGECLQKALRNEFMAIFDPSRIEPRLARVRKAMAAGEMEFADEIIRELQSESYLNPEIDLLRKEIEETRRAKTVKQVLETAKRRFDEEEYLLALQKVQEILDIEPSNTQAFTLKAAIESKRSTAQSEGALRLAQQHLDNRSYDLARQAAEKVLQLRPNDTRAQALLAEANRREQESGRIRQEKEKTYQAAIQAFGQGDVSAALSKLERLLDLDRRSPESTKADQSALYQNFYEKVRSKRDLLEAQHAEAKRYSADGNLSAALAICEDVLREYPNNVVFQALKFDVEEAMREEVSSYIAKVEKDVTAEPDLNRKVSLLEEARKRYPDEARFRQSLERYRSRRDLVQSIAGRAAAAEDSGQFADALGQWEIMRNTYPQYPGLDVEIDRLKRRREQQRRNDSKAQWVAQIDQALGVNDFKRAETLTKDAMAEFMNDPELQTLSKSSRLGLERAEQAHRTLAEGQRLLQEGKLDEAFAVLRDAVKLDPNSHAARIALVEALLQRAGALLDSDWRAAEPLVSEALELDVGNPLAKSLRTLIKDNHETEETTIALSKARGLQADGNIRGAIATLDAAIAKYPTRDRLLQLRSTLLASLSQSERLDLRARDLQELKRLAELSAKADDPKDLESIFFQTRLYSSEYANDNEFSTPLTNIQERMRKQGAPVVSEKAKAEETPVVVEQAPRIVAQQKPRRFNSRAVMAALSPIYKRLWVRVALGVVLVLSASIATYLIINHRRQPPPVTEKAKPLHVHVTFKGATQDRRVTDSGTEAGHDLTAQLKEGLAVGTYWLKDSKPGFQKVNQEFHINASDPAEREITAQWKPLSTVIQIGNPPNPTSPPSGEWKLDGMLLNAAQPAPIEGPAEGNHELVWSDGPGTEVKLQFTVKDGYPELEPLKGPDQWVGAVALAVGKDDVQVRPWYLSVRYTIGNSPPRETQVSGPLPGWNPATEPLALFSVWDVLNLGSIDRHDPKDGGLIYVAAVRRSKPSKQHKAPNEWLDEVLALKAQKKYKSAYSSVLALLQTYADYQPAQAVKKDLEAIKENAPDVWNASS